MKPGWNPRELFPPYQLAAAGMWVHLILFAAAILLVVVGRSLLAFILAALIAVIVRMTAEWGVACPVCGKPVMRYYLTGWGEERGGTPLGRRLWPERECSSCRAPLDIL